MTEQALNRVSMHVTQPRSQGASQAMLYASGLNEEDMHKAQVGIASVWYEGNPCNMHLLDLAEYVKEGVVSAGLVGMRFNTVGVSDAISMGTRGMSFSLQSRDLIADSVETVMGGQWYDGLIAIPGCDKNMPGVVMAMGRVNRPALMVYGGTIRAGRSQGNILPIKSVMPNARTLSVTPVQGLVPVGACIRRIPWPRRLKPWGCPSHIAPPRRRYIRTSTTNVAALGRPYACC